MESDKEKFRRITQDMPVYFLPGEEKVVRMSLAEYNWLKKHAKRGIYKIRETDNDRLVDQH